MSNIRLSFKKITKTDLQNYYNHSFGLLFNK